MPQSTIRWKVKGCDVRPGIGFPISFQLGPAARPEGADLLPAQGNALGSRDAKRVVISAQRANRSLRVRPEERLARWADITARLGSWLPRALPWAGRTSAPSGRAAWSNRNRIENRVPGHALQPFAVPHRKYLAYAFTSDRRPCCPASCEAHGLLRSTYALIGR